MPKHVYRVKMRDGSTHDLAADSADEARRLARQYYTGNIAGVKREPNASGNREAASSAARHEAAGRRMRLYRVTYKNGNTRTLYAYSEADARKEATRGVYVNAGPVDKVATA